MNLGDEVDLEDYVSRPDKISAAEVSLFCIFSLQSFVFRVLNFKCSTRIYAHPGKFCCIDRLHF